MNPTSVDAAAAPKVCLPRELVASTVFLLGRLGMAVKATAMEEFDREGFSPYHYSVLALLGEGSRETQATIANALQVDPSHLVGLLDGLEARELIERRRDPSDRRRHLVSLTPAGKRQLAALRTMVARIEDEFLAALTAEERATLHELLLRLAANRDARYVPLAPPAA